MGDLGNVIADEKGRAEFQIDDNLVKVNDIIGRSIVISNGSDDLGRGMSEMSKVVYFSEFYGKVPSDTFFECVYYFRSGSIFEPVCYCPYITARILL